METVSPVNIMIPVPLTPPLNQSPPVWHLELHKTNAMNVFAAPSCPAVAHRPGVCFRWRVWPRPVMEPSCRPPTHWFAPNATRDGEPGGSQHNKGITQTQTHTHKTTEWSAAGPLQRGSHKQVVALKQHSWRSSGHDNHHCLRTRREDPGPSGTERP